VTKKEIVKTISEEIGLTQLKTKEIVQKTFDAIVRTLVEDGRIELRNFGVFEVKKRKPRKARNPRTGTNVNVPEKFVVTFKPGKEMEERVRQLEQSAAQPTILPMVPLAPVEKTPEVASASVTAESDGAEMASSNGSPNSNHAGEPSASGNGRPVSAALVSSDANPS